jgi:hypothetical protein
MGVKMHRFYVPPHPKRDRPIELSEDAVRKLKGILSDMWR